MPTAVIIGGGLIGMLSALELRDAGWQVTLLERGDLGRESSWAGGGILSPLYPWKYVQAVNRLALWSQDYYPQLAERLRASTGIDPQYQDCGLLILDQDQLQPALRWGQANGRTCRLQSAAQLQQTEPQLRDGFQQAALFPQLGQVRNPRLLKAMRRLLGDLSVQLTEQQGEIRLKQDGARVGAVTAHGDIHQADAVVVAAGSWSAGLLEPLGITLPVKPVRGQMLLYRCQPGLIRHVVLYGGHYVIPRADGQVLMGSTLEDVGFDKHTTESARAELEQAAGEIFPILSRKTVVKHWAGLRPGSPESVPFIGKVPGFSNLYVNTGHYRNGVVMGPASARLLLERIEGRPCSIEPSAYQIPKKK